MASSFETLITFAAFVVATSTATASVILCVILKKIENSWELEVPLEEVQLRLDQSCGRLFMITMAGFVVAMHSLWSYSKDDPSSSPWPLLMIATLIVGGATIVRTWVHDERYDDFVRRRQGP